MPTVVHHDRPVVTESSSGAGALASVVAIVVLAILFFLYALPALRSDNDANINVPDTINLQTDGQQ